MLTPSPSPSSSSSSSRSLLRRLAKHLFLLLSLLLNYLFPPRLVLAHVSCVLPSLKFNINRKIKIVQLSDFHLDCELPEKISSSLLSRAVDLANEQKPDLIFLTGDYVDRNHIAVSQIAPYLKRLISKNGIFASLGNHDYKEGYQARTEIVRVLESCGAKVLTCETVRPFAGAQNFEIVGIGDLSCNVDFRPEDAFSHAKEPSDETGVTRLLLSHNPDAFTTFLKWKVDLCFSGHTHGGQICYPFSGTPVLKDLRWIYDHIPAPLKFLKRLFPIHVRAIENWDYVSGLHSLLRSDGTIRCISSDCIGITLTVGGTNQLYVSRGLGTHPPCRINCPCEVNVIEIFPEGPK